MTHHPAIANVLDGVTPYAQWICGPDASAGHECGCCESTEECCCLAEIDADGVVVCVGCGEEMIAIDFSSGEAASKRQVDVLMSELREKSRRRKRRATLRQHQLAKASALKAWNRRNGDDS